VLDGDAAGRRRTNEIIDALLALFEKNSVDLRILTLPQGIDPCDFIATHGCDSFRALLAQAVDALEHKFRSVTNGLDTLTDTHRASQAAEQLLATLAQIRPASAGASSETMLREQQMLSRISRQFHLPEEKLRSRLTAIRQAARGRRSSPYVANERDDDGDSLDTRSNIPARAADLPLWDRELLELVILEPTMVARLADVIEPTTISSPVARRIFIACCRLAEQGLNDFGRLMVAFDEPAMKNLLVQLDESAATKTNADRERWFADLVETARRRGDESSRRATLFAARQSDASAEQLLAQFYEQSRSKHLSDYERRKK
jgi:DNA primase